MNKKLLIFSSGILLATLFLLLIFFFSKKPDPVTDYPKTTITVVPTITPEPTDLFIQNALPPQNPTEPYLTFQKITLRFSEEIRPIDLRYEIEPQTDVFVRGGEDKKTIHIIPKTKWQLGSTRVTILTTTVSTSNKRLYTPYEYTLIIDVPPVPSGVFDIE